MSLNKNLIAAAVCGALAVSSVAEAKKKDDDSVHNWGPWASMSTPAAGGNVAGFNSFGSQPSYRPDVVVAEQDNNWIGYVMKYGARGLDRAGHLQLELDPDSGAIRAVMTFLDGTTHILEQNAHFYEVGETGRHLYWGSMDSGYTYRQFVVDGETYFLDTSPATHWMYGKVGGDEVTFGAIRDDSAFVAGRPTSLTDMSSLNAGNISASYSGYGWLSGSGYIDANMTVSFGSATWYGSWRSGTISASGGVSGNEFSSSRVGGANVTGGTVEGTFVENSANSAIGLMDIEYGGSTKAAGTFIVDKGEQWVGGIDN